MHGNCKKISGRWIGMDFGVWILFGVIVGLVVHLLDPIATKDGLEETLSLGIIGALFGGIVANFIFGLSISGLNLTSLSVATTGAIILLLIGRVAARS